MDPNRTKKPWRRRIKSWFIIFAVFALLIFFSPVIFLSCISILKYGFSMETLGEIGRVAKGYVTIWTASLVSDEEMIANFKAHREDFQRLTQLYLTEGYGNRLMDFKWGEGVSLETLILLERTGVDQIDGTSFGGLWLPDPYSVETARLAEKQDVLEVNPYESLIFEFTDTLRHRVPSFRYFIVTKNLTYFPVEPRIENGELLWPVGLDGNYRHRAPVLSSLNAYPAIWERDRSGNYSFSCVYRQIEPQWFIEMCRAK